MRVSPTIAIAALGLICSLLAANSSLAQEPDQMSPSGLQGAVPKFHSDDEKNRHHHGPAFGPGVTGIDSLVNFTGSFTAPGVDPTGKPQSIWPYSMVGNDPARGGTTVINAPIIPVSVLLLNYDGTPRYVNGQLLYSDASQYVHPVLQSPVFSKFKYSSSEDATQFMDAVQRAEFIRGSDDDWHTKLSPNVKASRILLLTRGTYRFSLNADGSCCSYILVDDQSFGNAVFPPAYPFDGTTIIGAAELAGDMTTKDITSLLTPNVFLYSNHDPNQCCIIGYHTYDSEPGTAANGKLERRYVLNFSSWVTPGLFGPSFADVTALSHELSETFNDPFVDNLTPWLLSPNGNCQDDLEDGDVVEGLPNATLPITLHGFTYHPQNEALLQYFEFKTPSNAIHHAYSYPDTTVLAGISAPQKASCK